MSSRGLTGRIKNTAAVAGVCALLIAGVGASVLLPAPAARAATLTLVTQPTALAWSGTLVALNTSLVDTTTGHTAFTVDDATGSGGTYTSTFTYQLTSAP